MKKTKRPTRTLFDIIKTKDINELITVDANSPVMEALMIMAKFKIGALIVMHKDKMAGIISERDYAREMILEGRSSRDTLVNEIMTKNRIRHMPIIDGKKLIGMVSQGDLVKEMIAYQKDLIAELEVFVYERAW